LPHHCDYPVEAIAENAKRSTESLQKRLSNAEAELLEARAEAAKLRKALDNKKEMRKNDAVAHGLHLKKLE